MLVLNLIRHSKQVRVSDRNGHSKQVRVSDRNGHSKRVRVSDRNDNLTGEPETESESDSESEGGGSSAILLDLPELNATVAEASVCRHCSGDLVITESLSLSPRTIHGS